MARKFLQMGFTRARRYANHSSGRKYVKGAASSAEGLIYPYASGSRNKGNAVLGIEPDATPDNVISPDATPVVREEV